MGVKVEGVEELMFLLRQNGQKAVRGAFSQMRTEATGIRDLARQMAPVDEGDLEAAIVTREVGGRDSAGRFAQKQIVIEVDGDAPAGADREGNVRTVGAYAYLMHEHLTPFGPYGLGPRSRLKQSSNPSVMVGGRFLERALAERERGLMGRIIERVRRELDE